MTADDYTLFRQWLVLKVKQSRWRAVAGEELETVARRLGVQPEVILEAQAALDADQAALGRSERVVGSPATYGVPRRVDVNFPKPVWQDWEAYCKLRQLQHGVLLRSLIHTLLSGPDQPRWLGRGWVYRGHRLRMLSSDAKGKKNWPYTAKTWITHGASRALVVRANVCGCTVTALMRGIVLELLEGRLERVLMASAVQAMWDDETRYWTLRE